MDNLRHYLPYVILVIVLAILLWLAQSIFGQTITLPFASIAILLAVVGSLLLQRWQEPDPAELMLSNVKLGKVESNPAVRTQSEKLLLSSNDLAQEVVRLQERVTELRMLGQFSEALNFTINYEAMLSLVYTTCHSVLECPDFYVHLYDIQIDNIYTAYCVENGQRNKRKEGLHAIVDDHRIPLVVEMGYVHEHQGEDGRYCLTAPLNAGASTVGALQAFHKDANQKFTADQQETFSLLATRTATAIDRWQTNQQLETRAQQLETLNEVIRSINSETEVQKLLALILKSAIELLNVEAGSFLLRDENTGELEFVVVHGPASEELVGTRLPPGKGVAGKVAQTSQPIIVNNVLGTKDWFSGVDTSTEFHTRSILTVPLVRQRNVLGVLQVINRKNGAPFGEADKMLLTAFAGEAAVTLENARLLQQTDTELQRRVRELTLLQSLDRDLNQTLDIQRSLQLTSNWMQRLFDAHAAGIILFNSEGNLIAAAHEGHDNGFNPKDYFLLEKYPGPLGEVARTGQPVCVNSLDHEGHNGFLSSKTISYITVPINHENRTIGAATVESTQTNAYANDELEEAIRFINHVTVAINNALLYDQVKAANLAKSEFVSMVSHELKTPLTAIRGFTDLMLSGLTGQVSPHQKEYLTTIINNVSRMMTLIQDLTDISRMDTGQLRVQLEPIPFANVISETITSIQGMASQKNITIQLDIPSDMLLILGDHSRLVQVLTNMLSNACKYSPPDTTSYVMVKRVTNETGRKMIMCSVKDSGYGISKEDQEKLFTKFFRSDNPDIRQAPGTGLGLSITKGLVELHGGELTFESDLGKGTTFSFTVPEVEA